MEGARPGAGRGALTDRTRRGTSGAPGGPRACSGVAIAISSGVAIAVSSSVAIAVSRDPTDVAGKCPEDFGTVNSKLTENGDTIRITWAGRIIHGGNLQYDEVHEDDGVTLTANGLLGGWQLLVAAKADLVAAGVELDATARTLTFRDAALTRIGGETTIILNGVLEYAPAE